jgi:hypothetical protein
MKARNVLLLVALLLLLALTLFWLLPWSGFFYDIQVAAQHIPIVNRPAYEPKQRLDVGSKFILEAFDAQKDNDNAIAVMKDKNGRTLWAVSPELYFPKDVRSIQLREFVHVPFFSTRVRLFLHEKDGHRTRGMFIVGSDGSLRVLCHDTE